MERFIRYLYEYEQDRRVRNVGFIKVEAGYGETIVHLQAKGFHNRERQRLALYLFYEENEYFKEIFQSEMQVESPVVSWHHRYSSEDVGGREIYNKICGLLIKTDTGCKFAAVWDDRQIDMNRFEENCCEETTCEETEAEEEIEEKEDVRIIKKIARKDISHLPRCEWNLANNQFLIHGYNYFHHLLLIDDGNYLKLGVPGIYHRKEAEHAQAYGFLEFLSAEELGMYTEESDQDKECLGYWCRVIHRGRKKDI